MFLPYMYLKFSDLLHETRLFFYLAPLIMGMTIIFFMLAGSQEPYHRVLKDIQMKFQLNWPWFRKMFEMLTDGRWLNGWAIDTISSPMSELIKTLSMISHYCPCR